MLLKETLILSITWGDSSEFVRIAVYYPVLQGSPAHAVTSNEDQGFPLERWHSSDFLVQEQFSLIELRVRFRLVKNFPLLFRDLKQKEKDKLITTSFTSGLKNLYTIFLRT